jgi:transcriptional regulator with XRE-family HTH domain
VRIAANIQRLRKDCGWSLDQLADKTGIDKKLVLAHVHGKRKPYPHNAKLYADTFSKALGRPIAASDLEK